MSALLTSALGLSLSGSDKGSEKGTPIGQISVTYGGAISKSDCRDSERYTRTPTGLICFYNRVIAHSQS